MSTDTAARRAKRHGRIRKKVTGTVERPRVNVFRSLKHMYVQAIDDVRGHTLTGLSTIKLSRNSAGNVKAAEALGKTFAELLQKNGVKKIVFDRGGYLYHGRVKALAESLRKGGIEF